MKNPFILFLFLLIMPLFSQQIADEEEPNHWIRIRGIQLSYSEETAYIVPVHKNPKSAVLQMKMDDLELELFVVHHTDKLKYQNVARFMRTQSHLMNGKIRSHNNISRQILYSQESGYQYQVFMDGPYANEMLYIRGTSSENHLEELSSFVDRISFQNASDALSLESISLLNEGDQWKFLSAESGSFRISTAAGEVEISLEGDLPGNSQENLRMMLNNRDIQVSRSIEGNRFTYMLPEKNWSFSLLKNSSSDVIPDQFFEEWLWFNIRSSQ